MGAPTTLKNNLFQSTHPVKGATISNGIFIPLHEFQSTHPVKGATVAVIRFLTKQFISIHAPREGCDSTVSVTGSGRRSFQSTHPVKGATRSLITDQAIVPYFNPRTP